MVLSSEPDASRAASCDQATDQTQSPWPFSVDTHSPVAGSQILAVQSNELDARSRVSLTPPVDLGLSTRMAVIALLPSLPGAGLIVADDPASCGFWSRSGTTLESATDDTVAQELRLWPVWTIGVLKLNLMSRARN